MHRQRILINNDNGRRDLLGLHILKFVLEKNGFNVLIAARDELVPVIQYFQPDVILAARGDNPVLRKRVGNAKVYVLPGEGGRQTRETMLSVFMGRGYSKLDTVDWISKCYLWNNQTRDWLLQDSLFKESQLSVVGNVRMDIYNHKEKLKARRKSDKFIIGIAFSATTTSSYYGNSNFAEVYHDSVRKDYYFPITGPNRHFEDIIWRDHAILRTMIHVIKDYMEEDENNVIYLRPNPLESIANYKFLEERYKGRFFLRQDETLPEFISEIDILLTCWSTTGMECLIMDVPVISISNMLDQKRLFDHISRTASGFDSFVNFYYLPQTFGELSLLISQAKKGMLPLSPKSDEEIAILIKQNFNLPQEELVAELIAKDLVNEFKTKPSNPIKFGKFVPYYIKTILIRMRRYYRAMRSGDKDSYLAFYKNDDKGIKSLVSFLFGQ